MNASSSRISRTDQTRLSYVPKDKLAKHNYNKLQMFVQQVGGKHKVTGYKKPNASLNI